MQDFVILAASVRRDGKSLGQMAREEIGPIAGMTALVAILGIMVVLLAVLALVVVNALKSSPWGIVTIGLTIPIAMLMGVYLRWIRPHRVLEASAIGIVLIIGRAVLRPLGRRISRRSRRCSRSAATTLAFAVMIYSFAASVTAGVAAARPARLSVGVREDRRRARARASAFWSRCRRCTCRR